MLSTNTDGTIINCGCGLILFVTNVLLGAWSVNYLLGFFLERTIPFLGAALIGLVAGQFTLPVAIVVALLRWFGVM
jgi:hypothetical protein